MGDEGFEQPRSSSNETHGSEIVDADSDAPQVVNAILAAVNAAHDADPRILELVARWPGLPADLRAAVLDLVGVPR